MIVRPVFPRLRLRLVAALLIVYTAGYAASAQDATRDNFHFSKFTNLRQGDRFHIVGLTGYAAGSKIGEGRIARLNARELLLEFSIRTTLSGPVSGRVDLTHIGRRARKAVLRLRYSGATPSGPEKTDEQVLAGPFLLTNGILTFRFLDQRHLFQLSIDSQGRNKLITTWGASRLERIP